MRVSACSAVPRYLTGRISATRLESLQIQQPQLKPIRCGRIPGTQLVLTVTATPFQLLYYKYE
jgi:hypothetical protein